MGQRLEGRPPHSPKGDVSYVEALESTARSGAHGFRSRRPRLLLTVPTIVGLGLVSASRRQPCVGLRYKTEL